MPFISEITTVFNLKCQVSFPECGPDGKCGVCNGTGLKKICFTELLESWQNDSELMETERFEQERKFCSWDYHDTPLENKIRQRHFWEVCQYTGEMP